MVLVKILKRRDASSVIVAILIAMIITQPLSAMTGELASRISSLDGNSAFSYGSNGGWQNQYLFPLVWAALQLIALEILGWVYVLANRPVRKIKK